MDADVRAAVLGDRGGDRLVETATLLGYRRVTLRRRNYPAIVADRASSVEGCVTGDLDLRAVAAGLDAYEGDEYDRIRLAVTLADGATVAAEVYVASRQAKPSALNWNLAAWQLNHKREFLRRLRTERA